MATIGRFFELPLSSFFLLGPRGTGKTTLLRERLPSALWINLLQADTYRDLAARPERLRDIVLGRPDAADVVIDEVQRVPELLHVVHDLIELRDRERRFVLTGSSARKLRRGGVDLLAGRALMRTMHPFLAGELPEFDLDAALTLGMLPLVRDAANPADTLAAYATLYLDQEVKAEGLVRNVGNFARFLEAASCSHGGVLNISNLSTDAAVSRKTAEGYLEIVEDLLIAYRLPAFTRRAKRPPIAHPKFYFFDAGVFRSLRPRGPLDRATEIEGAALEGLVAQHLRGWLAFSHFDLELFFWRTRTGVEVDFVLYGADGFWAIEVKNGASVRGSDVRALRGFVADYPECTPLLLYRGNDRLDVGGVRCIPVAEFLSELAPGKPIGGY